LAGTLAVASGGTGRAVGNYSVFSLEIHVSKDGNDTTGDGTLINPVLTVVKALTLVGAGRNTVIVHPGTYTESPTVSAANVTIATSELTGANTQISGTLTLSAAARVSGLKMTNLTITGSGNTYISNCTVDTRVIKSGSNYVEIINSELQCTLGIQITGAGTVSILGNKCWAVAVSNASANVLIKDCFQVLTPTVTAGNLSIDGCAINAAFPATSAVVSSAGSTITLANSFVLNSVGTGVERVSLSGSFSILNLVYDKTNSTFAGTNLNAIDYFSVINADTVVATGATIGAAAGTGTITLGQSTVSQTTDLQAGVTASGSTKTINIGTGGAVGSTTVIAIGSATGTSTTTINSTASVTGTLSVSGGFNVNAVVSNISIGTSQTTGLLTLGNAAGTGTITLGQSTVSQTTNIQGGATASGSTKTINIGTGGLSGSTTAITIGSTFGTSINLNAPIRVAAYTVATLPTAGTAGRRAYVTDALTPTFLTALVGGGAVRCPAFDNGTTWVAG
jgi:hypothetical protein